MKRVISAVAFAICLAGGAEALAQAPVTPAPAVNPAPAPASVPPEAAAVVPTAPPVPRTFYEAVRITFEGKSETPGAVGIEAQPNNGAAKVVWVRVLPKRSGSAIAEEVAKELTFALGGNFRIKTSGGRVIISKGTKASPAISVSVAGLSIYGISVKVDPD